MDGLYEIAPGSVPIEVAGQVWQIGPLNLADYAEMERRLLRDRRRPRDIARKGIVGQSEEQQRQTLGRVYEQECRGLRATQEELVAWLHMGEGMVFECWLRLRKNHPELTLERTDELLTKAGPEVFRQIASAVALTGEGPLGNAFGRGSEPRPPAAADRFLGGASFAA